MNTTKEHTMNTTYHILYNVEKPGCEALYDRDMSIEAESPQEAVNKLYNHKDSCGETVYEIEAVETYHEDELGGYFEPCEWA